MTERVKLTKYAETIDIDRGSLGEVLVEIQRLISEYGAEAKVDTFNDRYSDREYIGVFIERLETDEELATRLLKEEETARRFEVLERACFERLRAKFGDKN